MSGFSVSLDKEKVLEVVRANKELHRRIFEEAIEKYRDVAIKTLNHYIDRVKANEPITNHLNLERPVDHSDDYDRVLAMLERHTGDTIDMDEETYANFMDDEWSWSKHFMNTAGTYTAKFSKDQYEISTDG